MFHQTFGNGNVTQTGRNKLDGNKLTIAFAGEKRVVDSFVERA